MKPRLYILALARSFPCLRSKVSHLTPETWDVDAFMAASAPWSTGEQLCATFIAGVWDPARAREQGWHFDLFAFAGTADSENRAALLAWLANPIFP